MIKQLLVLLALIPQAVAAAPYVVAETGQGYDRLQDAVSAIGAGRGTIRLAPGVWHDCAVQVAGDVALVSVAPGQAALDGAVCEGKAAYVARGRSLRVEGITFQNLRVPEGNGAGIRLEHGDLAVRQTWFRDSEEGILSADDPDGHVTITQATFSRLGRCDRGLSCAHAVYFGNIASVVIRRSRFEAGRGGHYVKSHAGWIEVTDSSFDDARGTDTNYMIDLSVGASGRIAGNWFVQGPHKENNTTMIANAAEGHQHRADHLVIEGNTARLGDGVTRATAFFVDWSGDAPPPGVNRLGEGIRPFERR